MTLTSTFASLFFLSIGIAVINLLAVLCVNGVLRNTRAGFHELETLLAHIFGESAHPTERAARGIFALFLASWAATLAFIISWQIGFLDGSLIALAAYAIVLYALSGLVGFPLLGHGAFGHKHHPRAPLWTATLVIVFTLALAVTTALLF